MRLFISHVKKELGLLIKIKSQQYDYVIDMINNPRTAFLSYFTKAKIRSSFKTNFFRNLFHTHLIERKELVDSYLGHARLKLLAPLKISFSGLKLNNLYPSLPILKSHRDNIAKWLNSNFIQDKTFVLLSPTHRRPVRRWPSEKYIKLAFLILRNCNLNIIWLWGPGEKEFVEDINKKFNILLTTQKVKSKRKSILSPEMSLSESCFLAKSSLAFVGNSNGLSHVAVAGQVSSIEIHGPTCPKSWCHPNLKHIAIQRLQGCVQCSLNTCKLPYQECLRDLEVNNVFEKFKAHVLNL